MPCFIISCHTFYINAIKVMMLAEILTNTTDSSCFPSMPLGVHFKIRKPTHSHISNDRRIARPCRPVRTKFASTFLSLLKQMLRTFHKRKCQRNIDYTKKEAN